jgi:thioredoxin 1
MEQKTGNVTPLGKREFKQKIYDYTFSREWKFKGDKPAVIDFYADWCRPCKMIAPIMDQLSEEYEGKVRFYKVNTEKEPEVAKAFNISSIPTLLFIPMTGSPVVVRGAQPRFLLKRHVETILNGKDSQPGFLKRLFSFGKNKEQA